ncbi:S8 family serine peptidase [Bacillus sp. MCCB 382]|uniref:S8 family peptidase n=1 Tax=Bacillus sp. MCCB 382 TaxID=2860197 RepID=UPI001C56B41A|nr:S8 family serine peptidase [Bacillus sp. MCCB 382]
MKNAFKVMVACFLLLNLVPTTAFGQTDSREKYILFLNDDGKDLVKSQTDLKIEKEFSFIPAISVWASAGQVRFLEDKGVIKEAQKEQTYNVSNQTTPWAFEKMNITNEVRTNLTGKGVKVAVLDTGIDRTHPDLKIAGGTCVLKANCTDGYQDDNGHGTHVAGIIAAQNNNIGIVGVAPDVSLYGIKVLDFTGTGTSTTIISGIEWAIQQDIDVLNMSFTTTVNDPALKAVIDEAYLNGMTIIAAAGNSGRPDATGDTTLYPAKYDSVIGVGGLEKSLLRMNESSTGSSVEISAPGRSIVSTFPKNLDTYDGRSDGYAPLSGTSMAAPYITGIMALFKEKYPEQSNIHLRKLLDQSALDLGEKGRDPLYGFGIGQYTDEDIPGNSPTVKVKSDGSGAVSFMFEGSSNAESVDVYRDGNLLASSLSDSHFTDYVTAGTYSYLFKFHMNTGDDIEVNRAVTTSSPAFEDLSQGSWYAPHMIYLYDRQILNGTGEHLLAPSRKITRGEAVALIGRAIGLNGDKRSTHFNDVGNLYFASGYIQSAFESNILNGFPDGSFKPNQYVTRGEMAILLSHAYQLTGGNNYSFKDVGPNVSGSEDIYKLAAAHITEGYPDSTFRPNEEMRRSTFSVFLSRAESPFFIGK